MSTYNTKISKTVNTCKMQITKTSTSDKNSFNPSIIVHGTRSEILAANQKPRINVSK